MKNKRKMLLIQVSPKFHADIKSMAAKKRVTLKDYVNEAIAIQLQEDKDRQI